MKTVQMTLDEDLVNAVDKAAKRLGTSRSSFAREALRAALKRVQMSALERQHRAGYERKPVKRGEFDAWDNEQAWGDARGAARSGGTGSPSPTHADRWWC